MLTLETSQSNLSQDEGKPVKSFFKRSHSHAAARTLVTEALKIELAKDLEAKAAHSYTRGIQILYPTDRAKTANPVGIRFLEYAARRDNIVAMTKLGTFYQQGKFVRQDNTKAADYFHKAADLGSAEAAYNFGRMCRQGLGTAVNNVMANQYLKQAEKAGYRPPVPARRHDHSVIDTPRSKRIPAKKAAP